MRTGTDLRDGLSGLSGPADLAPDPNLARQRLMLASTRTPGGEPPALP